MIISNFFCIYRARLVSWSYPFDETIGMTGGPAVSVLVGSLWKIPCRVFQLEIYSDGFSSKNSCPVALVTGWWGWDPNHIYIYTYDTHVHYTYIYIEFYIFYILYILFTYIYIYTYIYSIEHLWPPHGWVSYYHVPHGFGVWPAGQ